MRERERERERERWRLIHMSALRRVSVVAVCVVASGSGKVFNSLRNCSDEPPHTFTSLHTHTHTHTHTHKHVTTDDCYDEPPHTFTAVHTDIPTSSPQFHRTLP